jgi:para-aminobenzoate synthetase/4-amino-4-deoxychorismate lyase
MDEGALGVGERVEPPGQETRARRGRRGLGLTRDRHRVKISTVRVSLRPDPSKGVFETMLVIDGRPVELEAHLERLTDSLRELYGRGLPARSRETVLEAAGGVRHGKLRLTVLRGGDGWLRSRIATEEVDPAAVFPSPERAAALRGFAVEDGLGAHKWADRRLLEHAAAQIPAGELPLLVDGGAVLEVSRGSVFAVQGGAVVTPPLDGRILPSIARRQALEVARDTGLEAREETLTLEDLLNSDEVFLSGSVRGIEPVRSVDGVVLAAGGELSGRLADGLRGRWLRAAPAEPVAAAAAVRPDGPPGR